MGIEIPKSALERVPSRDSDTEYPDLVEIRLIYGKKARSHLIGANEFFGRGGIGAPISGDALIAHINRLRRMGKPE
jgi:hypothetical protein